MLKRMIKDLLNDVGYDLRRVPGPRGWSPRYLARLCSPATVFDVGVGSGTPELYEAFPEAEFFLVDPIPPPPSVLRQLAKFTYIAKAAGETVGQGILHRDLVHPLMSSLQRWTTVGAVQPCERLDMPIDVTTLDTILKETPHIKEPILLKLDVEGHELNAIAGASEFLRIADTVIAEVSIDQRFVDGYTFDEFIAVMKTHGFMVFDILQVFQQPHRPGAKYADLVLKRRMAAPTPA